VGGVLYFGQAWTENNESIHLIGQVEMTYKEAEILVLKLGVLMSCIFSYFTALGILSALLVDLSKEFGISVAGVGQLITISVITVGLSAPLIGPFSDRIGRKRIVVSAQVILAISLLGYSISKSLLALIGFSVLLGLGGAMGMPFSLALVSDYFSSHTYGRAVSIVYAGQPIASLVGVPIGAFIADRLGWHWSFFALGAFSLGSAVVTQIVLSPSVVYPREKTMSYFSNFIEAFRYRSFLPIITGNTLLSMAHFAVATYLAAFLRQTYSLSIWEVTPFLLMIGVIQLAGVLAGGAVADKLNKTKICIVTQFFAGLTGFVLLGWPKGLLFSVLLGGVFMGLYSSNRPAFLSLMVALSDHVRGTVMGIQATSNRLGQALGAASGGLVLSWIGYSSLGIFCIVLSLLASSVFFYVSHFIEKTPQHINEIIET
jgi:predicted MFS family arabinose efflux permease